MKKENREEKNELLSLVSIISIIAVFAGLCFVCLFVLNRMGIYEVPHFISGKTGTTDVSDAPSDSMPEGLFERDGSVPQYFPAEASMETLKKLAFATTLKSTFSIRATVVYIQNDNETLLSFEAAKRGNAHKTRVSYAETGETIILASCDGNVLSVTEGENTSSSPCDGKDCFSQYSLMPDLAYLIGDDSEIIYTGEDGEVYEIIFDSGSGEENIITDVRISMSEGYLLSVRSYTEGKPVFSFETLFYSDNYDESVLSPAKQS